MSNSNTNGSERITGSFTLSGLPAGLFDTQVQAPAPVAQVPTPPPAVVSPQPVVTGAPAPQAQVVVQNGSGQPIVAPQPSTNNLVADEKRSEGGAGKIVFGIFVVVVLIVAAVVVWKWLIPTLRGGPSGPDNPGTVQQGNSGDSNGNVTTNPNPSTTPDDGSSDGDADTDPNATMPSIAEQAAILDNWYAGIPEENWLTKTAKDLGGSPSKPLGEFCLSGYALVMGGGEVVTRGANEAGENIAIIIEDYTVPAEWISPNGNVVVLDKQSTSLALVTTHVTNQDGEVLSGSIWDWDVSTETYIFAGNGSSSKYQ